MRTKVRTVVEVDYADLEQEVEAAYGHEWSFVADVEGSNDTAHAFDGVHGGEISDYDRDELNKFITTGQGQFLARLLLDDLVRTGRIAPGDYLVRVSW